MNNMSIEQKEVFYQIRKEYTDAKNEGTIIPDVVFELLDNLEQEYHA